MSPEHLLSAAQRAEGLSDPSVAINLTGVSDWSTQMPFIDLMKTARPWIGHEPGRWGGTSFEEIEAGGWLDENGWPTAIPDGVEKIGTIWDWGAAPEAAESRKGVYVLTYEGEGDVRIWRGQVLEQSPGRIVFENAEGGGFGVEIHATDPAGTGNHVRDIAIVREDLLPLHEAGALFNPEWIELIEDFRQLRFMNWMRTNNSAEAAWDDRPAVDDAAWTDGMPVEVMVRLANETGADPWFAIPHDADETWVRAFATYVRDNLDPQLTATVEYSNEAWNWQFQQTRQLDAARQAEWGAGHLPEYYAKRATEMALIWDEVFGAEAEARLVKTLGVHTVNSWATARMLDPRTWFEKEPDTAVSPAEVFDAIAATTYFGNRTTSDVERRQELLDAIADPSVDAVAWLAARLADPDYPLSVPQIAGLLAEQKAVADAYGLKLIAYEGGQHVHSEIRGVDAETDALLTGFMAEFVRSPEMAELYRLSAETWAEVADGPYMLYSDVTAPTRFGSWGHWSHLGDSTPRTELLESMNATPHEREDRAEGTFDQGITELAGGGDDTLVGTREEDRLSGGTGDDVLVGGRGDDALHGGAGTDAAVLSGRWQDYAATAEGRALRLVGPDGSDVLVSVERLIFEDGPEVDLTALFPEVFAEETADATPPPPAPEPDTPPPAPEPDEPSALPRPDPAVIVSDEEIRVFDDGVSGMTIEGLQPGALVGRELGLGEGRPGYVAYLPGASAEFDGRDVAASYWSLNENREAQGGAPLSASAVQTALAFGDVLVGAARIVGTAEADRFRGRDLDDDFAGGGGNDQLLGFGGDDRLEGGAGNDLIDGGAGRDTAVFSGDWRASAISAEGTEVRVSGPDGEDRLRNVEVLEFDGGARIELAEAPTGAPTAFARAAPAAAATPAPAALLAARADLVIGAGTNVALDVVSDAVSRSVTVESGADIDVAGNGAGNLLTGGAGANALFGAGGDDRLEGRDGDDALSGGAGDDTLEGGAGADRFVWGAGDAGRDRVLDFAPGEDVIELDWTGTAPAARVSGADAVLTAGEAGITLLGAGDGFDAARDVAFRMGEVGGATLTGGRAEIALSRGFVDPVAFAMISGAGDAPVLARAAVSGGTLSLSATLPEGAASGPLSATWAVFEAGSWALSDGTRIEIGKAAVGAAADGFAGIAFADGAFDSAPALLSQVQGAGGWAVTRQADVAADGAALALQGAEAAPAPAPATVGWIAAERGAAAWDGLAFEAGSVEGVDHEGAAAAFAAGFDAAPAVLAGLASSNGMDPAFARAGATAGGLGVSVGEETTRDAETVHVDERIDFLAFGGEGLLSARRLPDAEAGPAPEPEAPAPGRRIGAFGTATADHEETWIDLPAGFVDPVVFALTPSSAGPAPAAARIDAIGADGFSLRLQEPSDEDGWHAPEAVGWIALEAGTWRLPSGALLEVGRFGASGEGAGSFRDVDFSAPFEETPAVFSQIQAARGVDWTVTRQDGADSHGVRIGLQEEERLAGSGHTAETVGWFALEQGAGEGGGARWEAASLDGATDAWDVFEFAQDFEAAPTLLASLASLNGGDTAATRFGALDAEGATLRVMEETSADEETVHIAERLDVLAIEGDGLLWGDAWALA